MERASIVELQKQIDKLYERLSTAPTPRQRKSLRREIARFENKRREMKKGGTYCA